VGRPNVNANGSVYRLVNSGVSTRGGLGTGGGEGKRGEGSGARFGVSKASVSNSLSRRGGGTGLWCAFQSVIPFEGTIK